MSTEVEPSQLEHTDGHDYRMVSKAAIFSLVLGVVSLLAMVGPGLLVIPIAGIVCGVVGWLTILRHPHERSGKPAAIAGIVLSTLWLVGAASYYVFEYQTEVPEGFERISFY